MKLKHVLAAAVALLCSGADWAAATDYLDGWTEVTSLPTSNDELAKYYYVFVATEADLMVAQEKNVEQESQLTMVYRYPMNPYTWKQVVWTLEYSEANLYGIRNLKNSTHLMQSRQNSPWRVQFAWETAQSQWTQWSFAYAESWTIQNKLSTDNGGGDNFYLGAWDDQKWVNGEVLAGNKSGDNVGHYKIYQILRSDYTSKAKQFASDVTSTYMTNPSFDEGSTFAQKKANAVSTSITGWTVAEGGNYQYYTVAKSRSNDPDNDSGFGKEITAANGTQYVHIRHGWQNSTTAIQQTLSGLPVGEYVLSLDHKGATPRSKSPKLTMKATPAKGSVGGIAYSSYPTSLTRDNSAYTFETNYGDWSTINYTFYVTETGNVVIYIGCTDSNVMNSSNDEVILDNVTLTYKNYTATLRSAIDRAKLLYTRTADSDLNDAINTAQGVLDNVDNTSSYQATIDAQVTTLRSAINTAYGKVEFASGEDITFMLENASFESGEALSAIVTTAITDITTEINYASMQPVEGWVINSTEANIASGVFKYGSNYGINGHPANDIATPVTGHLNALGMIAGWGAKVQYKQNVTLPAGRYTITIPVFNKYGADAFTKNLIGFIEDGGTEHLVATKSYPAGSWTTSTIEFDLNTETSGYMSVGYQSVSGKGSGTMPRLYVDGLTITFTDAANAYAATKADAQSTIEASEYANVTGTEKTTLAGLLSADVSDYTIAQYFTAIDNINSAVATFTAAKESYDEYVEAVGIAATLDVTSVTAPANAEEAVTRAHELNVNIDTKVTSTYTYDVTASYAGTWAFTNLSENASGQHWSNDSRKYIDNNANGNGTATQTITLPAGNYVLKVAGRGSAAATSVKMTANNQVVNFKRKGDAGVGIDLTGSANFAEADATYTNGNKGRGWEWRFLPLTLAEETAIEVTLTIERSTTTWGSFSDFTILMSSTDATEEDYTALNTAIATAEAHTLGFEKGQYAPYANVEAITQLAAAKNIDQEATNAKGVVNGATAALTAANESSWTANAADVDAIYNGDFSLQEGAWEPEGWTRTNGWGTKVTDAASTSGKAYYNQKGSMQYGNNGVYTLPLVAETSYKLTFKYGKWDQEVTPTISVLNASNEGLSAVNCVATNTAYKDGMTSQTIFFTTGEAGNYVLTMEGNKNLVLTDVSLVKATATETTLAAQPANNTFYQTLTLDRTFSTENLSTLVLPFTLDEDATAAAFDKVYTLNAVEGESLKFEEATEIAAGKPYLVKAKAATLTASNVMVNPAAAVTNTVVSDAASTVTFTGTFTAIDALPTDGSAYVVSNNKLYSVNSEVSLAPYRAYFVVANKGASGGVKNFVLDLGDDATAVEGIANGVSQDGRCYNLAGQRVSKATKGLYIINGKKVVVK